ncbi:uncharacterized protein LOC112511244 [Cynara cardunculus var. scolymus]|uniref:Uncharacterized protein n=1 Tax=Cynara cardunculus var. scolymus TaxID=59895 RepID=A0A103YHE9_CYNCS|nr:uncharacterized protein LOC112511244 [Cynara cardunculus var. scolymus]KVI09164.1 hypothetical protein Ccrd_012435 [Cynara cardunculus var. scolymus]
MGRRGRQRQLETCPPTATGITKRSGVAEEGGGAECSGKSCRSCSARAIADCVAVCCCPCAVVNFFTLTFLKLPWMMGRKCLANNKKKRKKKKLKDVGVSRNEQEEDGALGKATAIGGGESEEGSHNKYSARFEAEKVWLELYRVDNLGFGRVSFNGIQSLG